MICPNCSASTTKTRSAIVAGVIKTGCDTCLSNQVQGSEMAARGKREYDKREYRKDLVQPNEVAEFITGYPDQARDMYDQDTLRKHSH